LLTEAYKARLKFNKSLLYENVQND